MPTSFQPLRQRLQSASLSLLILCATGPIGIVAAEAAQAASSATLGTVQSVQAMEVKGKGSGVGAVSGAVLGGLVGNQMGRGSGNALLTVGGAVAGGFAGNEVERRVKKHTVYKTTVKLDNGQTRQFTLGQAYAVGARVHIGAKNRLELASKAP